MFQKIICLWTMVIVTIGSGYGAMAMDLRDDESPTVVQLSPAVDKSKEDSLRKEYERLQEELKHLMEELKRLEKEAKEKIQKEILPRIQREIDKLREWLREFHLEDDEQEPLKT